MIQIFSVDMCPVRNSIPIREKPTKGVSLVSLDKKNCVRFLLRVYFHYDDTHEVTDIYLHPKLRGKVDKQGNKVSLKYLRRCLTLVNNLFRITDVFICVNNDKNNIIDIYKEIGFTKENITKKDLKYFKKHYSYRTLNNISKFTLNIEKNFIADNN